VVDERGIPVEGANVYCAAWGPDRLKLTPMTKTYDEAEGMTDAYGLFRATLKVYIDMRCRITKDTFYRSEMHYDFVGKARLVRGKWQPWGATNTVVLKRIRHPIPMYAKRVESPVPAVGRPIGFDLAKGDWVEPFGKGVVSDMVFTVCGAYVDSRHRDAEMTVQFSSAGDGIATNAVAVRNERPEGSVFISDHEAPASGYQPIYRYTYRLRPDPVGDINARPRFGQRAYIRVRTLLNEDGAVKQGWYGKLYGDLRCDFDSHKRLSLTMTYFLNPDGTRNVEFDPTRNLLKGLTSLQQVDQP
jgi:hypothetical protein